MSIESLGPFCVFHRDERAVLIRPDEVYLIKVNRFQPSISEAKGSEIYLRVVQEEVVGHSGWSGEPTVASRRQVVYVDETPEQIAEVLRSLISEPDKHGQAEDNHAKV